MQSQLLASRGTFWPMIRLATPVLVEHLLHVLVNYVDLWLAGNYLTDPTGQEAYVAAITQIGYVMWLTFNLFAVVAIGSTALIARFVGAGDWDLARRTSGQALLAGGAIALAVMLTGTAGIDHLLGWLRLRGDAAAHVREYLLVILLVLPAVMINEVAVAGLRAAGDMWSGLLAMTVVNVVNFLVGAGLLFGWGPLPELGWRGLAIGAAVGHVAGAAIIVTLLLLGRAGLKLTWSTLWPDPGLLKRLLRIGIPGGLDALLIVLGHCWYLAIINNLGTLQSAAHGIGVRIEALAYMPAGAFQAAAATLSGQYLGAGDRRRAHRSIGMALATAVAFLTSAGLVFFFAARPLTIFFLGGDESAVVPITTYLLKIVALTMPPLAVIAVLTGALRGAGDTRWPLAITFLGLLAVRIPLTYLMTLPATESAWALVPVHGLAWGVAGAWYAMAIDVFLRSLLIAWRFLHGGWTRVTV